MTETHVPTALPLVEETAAPNKSRKARITRAAIGTAVVVAAVVLVKKLDTPTFVENLTSATE